MICPDCGYDNIPGVDLCASCGQPLSGLDDSVSDLERAIINHPVSVLVPKRAVTVNAGVSVLEAIQGMVNDRIGCLLVEEEGRITGVFTERDVLNRVIPDSSALSRPVSEFMTASPETVVETDSLAYAIHAMTVGGYRHLPVSAANGEAVGIISARDLLRFLSVRFADIRDDS